jgi:hypothetical protein
VGECWVGGTDMVKSLLDLSFWGCVRVVVLVSNTLNVLSRPRWVWGLALRCMSGDGWVRCHYCHCVFVLQ